LQRCLDKDLRRRLHDIADARIEIEDALSGTTTSTPTAQREVRPWRTYIGWAAAGVAAVMAFVLGRVIGQKSAADVAPTFSRVVRLTSGPAVEMGPAISPDGKWIAYLSNARGPADVWVKFLAGGERPISRPRPASRSRPAPELRALKSHQMAHRSR